MLWLEDRTRDCDGTLMQGGDSWTTVFSVYAMVLVRMFSRSNCNLYILRLLETLMPSQGFWILLYFYKK